VQSCKFFTTTEGCLEPFCGLTHLIIQARRCRPVSMRSRGLRSASSRPLAIDPDFKPQGHSHAQRCAGLHVGKTVLGCQNMTCFVKGHSVHVLVQKDVANADASVRTAFPRPVAHLLGHRQVLLVGPDRLGNGPQRPIRISEVPVRPALPHPVAHLLDNRQVLREVLDRPENVPRQPVRDPEVPVRTPSPARSPTSLAIARCCVW
jgi:hypothetical protein